MLLWLTFALLAAAVATLLMRSPWVNDRDADLNPDMAVYRDQLAELDADVERGVVTGAEAASARAEIARRLLKLASPSSGSPGQSAPAAPVSRQKPELVLLASAIGIPVACMGLYLAVGSPSLPGRPLAERLAVAPQNATTDDLIAKVEARLREKPDDGMGWSVLAPVYLSQGRLVDAGRAFERAIALLGETPDRLSGLAKTLVLANNGVVVEPARKAYERLLVLDPGRPEARFWLAISDEQSGRTAEAETAYRQLLADAPTDAPWRPAVEARLAALAGAPTTTASPPPGVSAPVLSSAAGAKAPGAGPTPAEFVTAAERLPAEIREQMIGRMITRAAEAVKASPKDISAWTRLVTGYRALGRASDAASALKQARDALAGDQSAKTELDALASSLGLAS